MDLSRLYDRWAATYDTDRNRTRDLAAEVLRRELEGLLGGDLVEVGCGTGRNTVWLAERSRRVVAVDFSRAMLERARERVGEARLSPGRVGLVAGDLRHGIPAGGATADLVVFTLVLEHVRALGPVFAECVRVLRPGGAVHVAELHPDRQRAGVRPRFHEGGRRIDLPAFAHPRSEFLGAAAAAGLKPERVAEWRAHGEEEASPRLLSLLLRRG